MPKPSARALSDDPDRLSGQDLAFLGWESRRRPMHIGVVATFRPSGAPPSLDAFRSFLAERLPGEPRFRQRLERDRRGRHRWREVEDLRVEHHVREISPLSSDPDALAETVDRLLEGPLDRSRPLWEMWLVPRQPGPDSFTVVAKVHHALLDGVAGVGVLERLLGGDVAPAPEPRPARRAATGLPARDARPSGPSRRTWSRFGLGALLRLVRWITRGSPRTPLTGRVTPRRQHRWFSLDAASFREAARVLGGTHNDALLASVSGALRRWLAGAGLRVPATLRAFCPVNLRGSGEGPGRGNRISLWMVDLPLGTADLRERIENVRAATRRHKERGDARGGVSVARLAERLGTWVSTLGMAVAAFRRAFHLVVTNVPGPARPLTMLGAELESLVPFAPLFPGQRVAVAVMSYAGRLHVGVNDGWQGRAPGDRFASDLREALSDVCTEAEVADEGAPHAAGVA